MRGIEGGGGGGCARERGGGEGIGGRRAAVRMRCGCGARAGGEERVRDDLERRIGRFSSIGFNE